MFEDPTIKFRGKNSCPCAWLVFSSSVFFSTVTHFCYRKKENITLNNVQSTEAI